MGIFRCLTKMVLFSFPSTGDLVGFVFFLRKKDESVKLYSFFYSKFDFLTFFGGSGSGESCAKGRTELFILKFCWDISFLRLACGLYITEMGFVGCPLDSLSPPVNLTPQQHCGHRRRRRTSRRSAESNPICPEWKTLRFHGGNESLACGSAKHYWNLMLTSSIFLLFQSLLSKDVLGKGLTLFVGVDLCGSPGPFPVRVEFLIRPVMVISIFSTLSYFLPSVVDEEGKKLKREGKKLNLSFSYKKETRGGKRRGRLEREKWKVKLDLSPYYIHSHFHFLPLLPRLRPSKLSAGCWRKSWFLAFWVLTKDEVVIRRVSWETRF